MTNEMYSNGEQIGGCKELKGVGWGRELDVLQKGNMRDPCGDGGVLYVDSINVNILAVILFFSFAKCYHWTKLRQGYLGYLCSISLTTACEPTVISNKNI